MKVLLVALLALVAVVNARNINIEEVIDLEDITAYGYHTKIGIPLANKIREWESRPASRIVGGSQAVNGQFPYQVGLLLRSIFGQSVCGASLISASRVLTAAHCWFDGVIQAFDITAVFGSVYLFSGGTRVSTNNILMHPSWNPNLLRNNIAVIRLPSNVPLSNLVAPVALPAGDQLNEIFLHQIATVSGFGRTSQTAPITVDQVLSFALLPVLSNEDCLRTFPQHIQPNNLCTSSRTGRNVCGGDSGGPLVITRNNRPLQIGVVSFGAAAGCEARLPTAYTRTSSFMTWINVLL